MVRRIFIISATAVLLANPVSAQECDDFDDCTANDMCSEGLCTGMLQMGSCDDGNPCSTNDHCVMDDQGLVGCLGDQSAPVGTACGGGCGTCQAIVPIPGLPLTCIGDMADNGQPCDSGIENPCLDSRCQILQGNIAFCFPEIKECPDTDGNLCNDACDFETGECETAASTLCDPNCESCNPGTGVCSPGNVGGPCNDFNECTATSSCQTLDDVHRTFCLGGGPSLPTPTATGSTGPTPTRTPGTPGACVGDCDNSGGVAINELVLGVNISLGSAQISQCTAFDRNSSGEVEVSELVSGVNSSLNGCS